MLDHPEPVLIDRLRATRKFYSLCVFLSLFYLIEIYWLFIMCETLDIQKSLKIPTLKDIRTQEDSLSWECWAPSLVPLALRSLSSTSLSSLYVSFAYFLFYSTSILNIFLFYFISSYFHPAWASLKFSKQLFWAPGLRETSPLGRNFQLSPQSHSCCCSPS